MTDAERAGALLASREWAEENQKDLLLAAFAAVRADNLREAEEAASDHIAGVLGAAYARGRAEMNEEAALLVERCANLPGGMPFFPDVKDVAAHIRALLAAPSTGPSGGEKK